MRKAIRIMYLKDREYEVQVYRLVAIHGGFRWRPDFSWSLERSRAAAEDSAKSFMEKRPGQFVLMPGLRSSLKVTDAELRLLCGFSPKTPSFVIHDYLIEEGVLS